jgi:hypothetical protein
MVLNSGRHRGLGSEQVSNDFSNEPMVPYPAITDPFSSINILICCKHMAHPELAADLFHIESMVLCTSSSNSAR